MFFRLFNLVDKAVTLLGGDTNNMVMGRVTGLSHVRVSSVGITSWVWWVESRVCFGHWGGAYYGRCWSMRRVGSFEDGGCRVFVSFCSLGLCRGTPRHEICDAVSMCLIFACMLYFGVGRHNGNIVSLFQKWCALFISPYLRTFLIETLKISILGIYLWCRLFTPQCLFRVATVFDWVHFTFIKNE